MTTKIYEYRDEENWFIGRAYFANLFGSIGSGWDQEEVSRLAHLFDRLTPAPDYEGESETGLGIEILHLASYEKLFQFALDMVNDMQGRYLELVCHHGALLVKENQQLLLVYLPKTGVPFEEFLGLGQEGKS